MTITHLASDELLMRYASGRMPAAPALVLSCHLAMSGESRARMDMVESLGGVLLDDQPMAAVSDDLFDRTMARLLDSPAPSEPRRLSDHGRLAMGVDLPEPLKRRSIGPWRWMGPGMRYARVEMPEDPSINLVLLRIGAGRTMPEHGHTGQELTLVLKGAFRDEHGRYTAGDLAEEDGESEHQPVVDSDGECICLAAIDGPMRPHSWIARAFQPFIGL